MYNDYYHRVFQLIEGGQVVLLRSVPLFQSLVLLLLIAGQDTHYQYPVYVIALIAPGLLFAKKTLAASQA